MKGVYLGQRPLNILSCAVEGRPGRSAYDTAVAGGYTGTAAEYETFLGGLPAALTRLTVADTRVNGILEYLGNQISELELAVESLAQRLDALEAVQ